MTVACFDVCRKGVLKVNAVKGKVKSLGGEEGSVCEFIVNESQLEDV